MKEGKELFLTMLGVNALAIALLALAGWFAYLDNGYWGWPFIMALLCAKTVKTREDILKERKEEEEEKQRLRKKFGDDIVNRIYKDTN